MATDDQIDAIPSELSEFIAFFQTSMTDVKFPGVDAETLATLAQMVRDKAGDLDRLNEQVRVARVAFDEAQLTLRKQAEKGLAYTRVYADGDEQLNAKLSELAISREEAPAKPRKRKSKSRTKSKAKGKAESSDEPTGELPFVASNADAA